MKILLVSWSILPQSGGSSVIVENLAENFSKDQLIVLGSTTWSKKEFTSRNPNGPEFRYFFSEMYFMGRGYRYFTWFRKWRFKPLINAIKNLIKVEGIDHVIAVYPNPFYCLAASRAAASMDVPFSSYFHNTYIENKAIIDPKASDIQQEIFDNSEHIFVMSEGMKKYYEEKYQIKKFIPLVHTFNEYPKEPKRSKIGKTCKLVAIGNFNESNLDATKRLLNAIKGSEKFTLSVYTHVPKILLQQRGMDPNLFEHKGSVLPNEVHDVIQDYDVCILTHGFTGGYGEVEYKTIFPTRTIPLLLSGKPILAHSPKGSFLNDFIEKNECAHLVDESVENKILEGLEKIVNDSAYQAKLIDNARKTANLFYGPNVTKELLAHLRTEEA